MQITLPHNGWLPRPDQMPFWRAMLDPNISTCVLAAHRRWGKDECVLHMSAIRAHQRVGTFWHALPQYAQCRKAIWEAVNPRTSQRRIFDAFPQELIENLDEQAMRIRFKNNSVWQLVGSDQVDSLVGTSPIDIAYSEAALADERAFGLFRPILLENHGKETYISTPRGRNAFYRIYETAKTRSNAFVQTLSALETPVFTPAQLQEERRLLIAQYGEALGNALYEQEYLCSFDSAIIGAVFGKELTEAKIMPVPYDSRYPVDTSWDLGVRDTTVILFWQVRGKKPYLIDWYAASDIGFDHFAEVLASKPYYYGKHIGPHDVAERSKATALSYAAHAESLGVRFKRMPNTRKQEQIAAASILLKQAVINADMENPPDNPYDDCAHVVNMLQQYAYSFDTKTRLLSRVPIHDHTSHYADALMTYAIYFVGSSHVPTRTGALQGRFDNAPRLSQIHAMTGPRRKAAFG